ncbi:MAG: hypothetical protein JO199_01015 [Candidatus Eremiobacteraeota bacterium]|nr:hypothetical protein [Candidatus Eremiobacteraeota bacterium]
MTIVATLLVVFFYYAPLGHYDFAENWGDGTYGASLEARSSFVDTVQPGSPADRGGIRPGDQLLGGGNGAGNQLQSLFLTPYAGETRTFSFERSGRTLTVTLRAVPVPNFGLAQRIGGILAILPATIFLAVAAVLLFLRPSVMMWSFYIFAVGYYGTAPLFGFWSHVLSPDGFLAMAFVLVTICGSWSVMALLPFLLRFPRGDLPGWRYKFDKVVWIVMALGYVVYVAEWRYAGATGMLPWWSLYSDQIVPLLAFAFGTLILAKNYSVALPAERKRWGFLAVGTIASFVAYAVYFVPGVPFVVGQVVGFAVVLMPICVAYSVFQLRVIDVSFVLNRALVYSSISVAVIAFISLLDWLFSRVLSVGRFAIGVELLATIAIGFLLDRINRFVERGVEGLFFRTRRNAEAFLKRVASALPYATEEGAISQGLVDVPAETLQLVAAALYRRSFDEKRFEGVATSANTPVAPPGFDAGHLLPRMLLSSERPVWLDEVRSQLDPENAAMYVLAIPVTVRHELVSFALYGAHANGAQLDPEEVELLSHLAQEASRAYDHVESVRLRERYALAVSTQG